jgi:hypothetical protein
MPVIFCGTPVVATKKPVLSRKSFIRFIVAKSGHRNRNDLLRGKHAQME